MLDKVLEMDGRGLLQRDVSGTRAGYHVEDLEGVAPAPLRLFQLRLG